MIIEIEPVVVQRRTKYEFKIDDNEPEILGKTALRYVIGDLIKKL